MRLWDNAQALRSIYRWLYACVIVCLVGAVGVWLVDSPYFPVKQVKIAHPVAHIDAHQLRAVVQRYLHGNIFKVDVNGARKALAQLPWVDKVEVKRLWPDTVLIDITERRAVARWSDGRLIDSKGYAFNGVTSESLLAFSGSQTMLRPMVAQLAEFERIVRPTGLKIAQLQVSDRSSWDVVLDNGITVRLGSSDEVQRLAHFVWAWPKVLQPQAERINYVDMRYKDGFAVGNKNTSALRRGDTAARHDESVQAALAASVAD